MRRVIAVLVVVLIVGVAPAGFAQDRVDQTKPTPAPAAKEEREVPRTPAKLINVQVEVTITDQIGTAAPTKKTVSLITSDNTVGRIRSRAQNFSKERGAFLDVNLNIDALPRVVGEQVLMNLTIEYNPIKTAEEGTEKATPTQLNQSLTIVMTNGKPMIVSQAADPVTDRKIVVEAKATILR